MENESLWVKQSFLVECSVQLISVVYLFFLKVTLITYTAPPEFCPNITLTVTVYHLWRSAVSFPLSRMTRLGILGIYSIPCEGGQVHTEQNDWILKLSWKRIISTSTLDSRQLGSDRAIASTGNIVSKSRTPKSSPWTIS